MTILFEVSALVFGTKEFQLIIFAMMISKAVATASYNLLGDIIPNSGWGSPDYTEEGEESISITGIDAPGLWLYIVTVPIDVCYLAVMTYGVYFQDQIE